MKTTYTVFGNKKQGYRIAVPTKAKVADEYSCASNDDTEPLIIIKKRDLAELIESVEKRLEEQRSMNTGTRTIEVSGYGNVGDVFLIDYTYLPIHTLMYVPVPACPDVEARKVTGDET